METLEGRTALVTGASRGLGAAIALELGARGAKVAVNYFAKRDRAEQLCAEIKQQGGEAAAFLAASRRRHEKPRLRKNHTNRKRGLRTRQPDVRSLCSGQSRTVGSNAFLGPRTWPKRHHSQPGRSRLD